MKYIEYEKLEIKEKELKAEIDELFHQFQKADNQEEKEKLGIAHYKKVRELKKIITKMERWEV